MVKNVVKQRCYKCSSGEWSTRYYMYMYTPRNNYRRILPAVSRRRLAPATMGSAKEYHLSVRSLHLKVQEDVPGSLGEGGHHLPHASQVCPSQRCCRRVVGWPDFRSIANDHPLALRAKSTWPYPGWHPTSSNHPSSPPLKPPPNTSNISPKTVASDPTNARTSTSTPNFDLLKERAQPDDMGPLSHG